MSPADLPPHAPPNIVYILAGNRYAAHPEIAAELSAELDRICGADRKSHRTGGADRFFTE